MDTHSPRKTKSEAPVMLENVKCINYVTDIILLMPVKTN